MFEGSRMAALSYLKETEEGKERKSGLAAQARLFFGDFADKNKAHRVSGSVGLFRI
nr:MAG TPA: hypothetical protein [Caudoviricetes sp.]